MILSERGESGEVVYDDGGGEVQGFIDGSADVVRVGIIEAGRVFGR
jgi:hypothetical protein